MNNRKYYEANDHECSLIRWRMRVRQAVAARGTLDRDFSGGGRGAIGRVAPPKKIVSRFSEFLSRVYA